MLTTDLPVRRDLGDAVASEWERLAAPGTWWSATDRVAIAAAARAAVSCPLCARRKASLSPEVAGTHDGPQDLGAVIVDTVHRIRTDPARLSLPWLTGVLGHVTTEEYVELVGVVLTETFVDSLASALGTEPPPLPEPRPGEPTRTPPPPAVVHSAWVPTVRPEDATGLVAEVYGTSAYREVSNVIRALSLVPTELMGQRVRGSSTYRSPYLVLERPQVELLATATSAANDCFY